LSFVVNWTTTTETDKNLYMEKEGKAAGFYVTLLSHNHQPHFYSSLFVYSARTHAASTPETRQCPNLGQFAVTGLVRDGRKVKDECKDGFTLLRVGCSTLDTLQFRSGCSNADVIAGE